MEVISQASKWELFWFSSPWWLSVLLVKLQTSRNGRWEICASQCCLVNSPFQFKEKQGKDYSKPDEKSEAEAEEAFKKNVELINKHNSDPNVSYKLGVNDATDKTKGERVHRRGMKPNNKNVKSAAFSQRVKGTLPASLDYSRFAEILSLDLIIRFAIHAIPAWSVPLKIKGNVVSFLIRETFKFDESTLP